MTVLDRSLTPKMKRPVASNRPTLVAGLDVGTSKIACLIARLKPHPPHDVLPRRSHAVEIIGFSHTGSRGIKTGTVVEVDHPTRGKYLSVGNPIKLSASPTEVTRSPLLGEHTDEILTKVLRYNDADLAQIKASGAITPAPKVAAE